MKAIIVVVCVVGALLGIYACTPKAMPRDVSPATGDKFAVTHTDAEWRALLGPAAYQVLREAGTERPESSPLLNEHREGTFVCDGCGQKLFESSTKFDSGTGWPSFYQAIKGAVIERTDNSIGESRTEVLCARCGGHLGHVFVDGPKPTGLRYCMNGIAMKFVPAEKKK